MTLLTPTEDVAPVADAPRAEASGRITLFGIEIDTVRMHEAVARVLEWTVDRRDGCRYVVTPNVDHAVMYQERDDLRQAYAGASLVLADGRPVVWVARLLGHVVPERVPGSELAGALFRITCEANRPLRVYLLGAAPGVAERAARFVTGKWPNVEIVGTYSPPLGFEHNDAENEKILARIADARPEVVLIGLGAPKQELWVARHRERIDAGVALCVGATIDFLAGERRRAPKWIRQIGFEWLHRVCGDPRRLARRYARDAWVFPQLVWKEWRSGGAAS